MGLNFRKQVLFQEKPDHKYCKNCDRKFPIDAEFCSNCGSRLILKSIKIYANMGKNGITSFTYKNPDGTTFNSKGKVSKSLGNGMSYTTDLGSKK